MVVVVDGNQVAELQVTSSRSSFAGNTLHGASIAEEHKGVVVDELIAGLVEHSGSVLLRNGKTDGVGETLTKRSSGDLNTGGIMSFRVARCDAVNLLGYVSFDSGIETASIGPTYTEVLQVVDAYAIAEKVQQSILEHTSVTVAVRAELAILLS